MNALTDRDVSPCVILTRRRTGASDLYHLLGNYVPWTCKGTEPFIWSRSMGEVSRQFHTGDAARARALLMEFLAEGVFFKHQFETDSYEFNQLLLSALSDAGYRVLHVERECEDERLFSLVIATHFKTWARESIESIRDRLREQEDIPSIDLGQVRQLVRDELAYRRWIEAEWGRHRLARLTVTYESFFRNGLQALPLADEVFAFAGLGSRASMLDDASLLRFLFSGEHHTLGLIQYSPVLFQVHQTICEELEATRRALPA